MKESHFEIGGWGYGGGLDMRFSKGELAIICLIKSMTYKEKQLRFTMLIKPLYPPFPVGYIITHCTQVFPEKQSNMTHEYNCIRLHNQ